MWRIELGLQGREISWPNTRMPFLHTAVSSWHSVVFTSLLCLLVIRRTFAYAAFMTIGLATDSVEVLPFTSISRWREVDFASATVHQ